jgi:hypothetical protein
MILGRAAYGLKPETAIIHLAIHAMNRAPLFGFQMLHLCDVAWSIYRSLPAIDEASLWETARKWGATSLLARAMDILARLFPSVARDHGVPCQDAIWRRALAYHFDGPRVVDQVRRENRVLHTIQRVSTQATWEISTGRAPRGAAETLLTICRRQVGKLRSR